MSNPMLNRSPEQAAALELTLAVIARLENSQFVNARMAPAQRGKEAAEFINAIYNETLANLRK